uniref:Uncharacterized protein n=1 Tax=Oryza brachyantha TaxID=4533 RepID=J3LRJ4_ORYBR
MGQAATTAEITNPLLDLLPVVFSNFLASIVDSSLHPSTVSATSSLHRFTTGTACSLHRFVSATSVLPSPARGR